MLKLKTPKRDKTQNLNCDKKSIICTTQKVYQRIKFFLNINCDKTKRTKIVIFLGKTKTTIAIKFKNSNGEKNLHSNCKNLKASSSNKTQNSR